jgi:hypothetical protein
MDKTSLFVHASIHQQFISKADTSSRDSRYVRESGFVRPGMTSNERIDG